MDGDSAFKLMLGMLVLGLISGAGLRECAAGVEKSRIRGQAVEAGCGEFYQPDSTSGDTEFRFKTERK